MSDDLELQSPYEPDDPREWLRLAREDLTVAGTEIPGVGLELHAHHAQQAAEKALKAVCIAYGIEFPFTHSIKRLLDVLAAHEVQVEALRGAQRLTRFAVRARYPRRRRVTRRVMARSLSLARQVVEWGEVQSAKGPDRLRERRSVRYPAPQRGTQVPDAGMLEELVARIVAIAAPERIILFGSAARGMMGPRSDLDLLIVTEQNDDDGDLFVEIEAAVSGLHPEVDIVLVTPDEVERYGGSIGLVYRPALAEGRELYRRASATG
jgi:HEPN domain-containing protein/predicted nucleotidyltransferase